MTLRALVCVVCVLTINVSGRAESVSEAPPLTKSDAAALSQLLRNLMLSQLPHEYENTKQWGSTREMWDGLKISFDDGRIKTKRRKKQANHGTWRRYSAWLIEPEKTLRLNVSNVRQKENGSVELDLSVHSKLGAFGRLSQWRWDVQLYSFGVHAEAHVTLRLRCEIGFSLDFQHLPPDLLLRPVVRRADLYLDQFRLRRISDLDGPLVKQLGSGLHDVLQGEIHQRRDKLVQKINRQIEKNRDRMRLSLYELLRWDQAVHVLKQSGIELESTGTPTLPAS